jgi:hypothetical protein
MRDEDVLAACVGTAYDCERRVMLADERDAQGRGRHGATGPEWP